MNSKRGFISILFFSFLATNIIAQVNVPDTPYCEKSIEFLKKYCYICEEYKEKRNCIIEKFDYLGEANNKHYYYGVYLDDLTNPDYKHYKFAIYEGNSNNSYLKPIHFFYPRYGGYEYYDFKLVKTKYGYIIHIQLVDESAGWDDGEYIIYRNGKWERLREPSWYCASEGLLPEGYDLNFNNSEPYIKIDLKTMSIKIPVYEGGFAIFNLVVQKDRFGIVSSNYVPDTLTQNTETNFDVDSFSYCEQTIDFLQSNCYTCGDTSKDVDCKIKEFKSLGEANGKQYYYGLYSNRSEDDDYEISYFIIYESKRNREKLKPVHYFYPDDTVEHYHLEMANTKYGLIIHIYVSNGNGHWDFGEYIIYRKGRWEKLKVPEWECVYEWVKPEEYWFCKGSTIDLTTMTIKFHVYSLDDPCATPTKGIVKSKLTIDENGFRVISSKYYPHLTE